MMVFNTVLLPPAHAVVDPGEHDRHAAISYPAARYRSALIGIAVHSVQTVVLGALVLVLVLR